MIANRSKWTDEDDNLAINDIVYFMLEEKEFKPDWRVGKVDSVKIGRDGKVREVNIAYKVMKDDSVSSWTHNVVTRPTRKVVKLFELEDTTFADDMRAVYNAAKEILRRRGCTESPNQFGQFSSIVAGSLEDSYSESAYAEHKPFIACINANSWRLSETNIPKETVKGDYTESDYSDPVINEETLGEELLFLI